MPPVLNFVENVAGSSLESSFYSDQPALPRSPSNSPNPLSCKVCQKTFDNNSQLLTHTVVYHGGEKANFDEEKRDAPGASRRKRRSGRARLNRLLVAHTFYMTDKPFACELCLQSFAYKYELVTHMETHAMEETMYSCNICKREFLEKEHLDAHLRSTTYDPSACDICGAKFPSWTLLSNHRLEHLSNELPS